MKTCWKVAFGIGAICIIATGAMAQFAKPEDAIQYRKSMMTLIGNHFGRLGAVVKGQKSYDQNMVKENARDVEMLTHLDWNAFLFQGSGKDGTEIKGTALEHPDQFSAHAETLRKTVEKLAQVTDSSDEAAFKTQFGATAQACKACHDQFRKD